MSNLFKALLFLLAAIGLYIVWNLPDRYENEASASENKSPAFEYEYVEDSLANTDSTFSKIRWSQLSGKFETMEADVTAIIVDNATGVQYVVCGGGQTQMCFPRLDSDGKPILIDESYYEKSSSDN